MYVETSINSAAYTGRVPPKDIERLDKGQLMEFNENFYREIKENIECLKHTFEDTYTDHVEMEVNLSYGLTDCGHVCIFPGGSQRGIDVKLVFKK